MQQTIADVLCCPLVSGTWKLQLSALRALQPFISRFVTIKLITKNNNNKKYVLWNMGICPIALKLRHVTLATPTLGSFIVPYVVLPMAYPTKKTKGLASSV